MPDYKEQLSIVHVGNVIPESVANLILIVSGLRLCRLDHLNLDVVLARFHLLDLV